VALFPQPQRVVVHHPGAAEHPPERLLLPRRGVQPIAVPDQHSTATYCWPTTTGDDHCRGRHVVSAPSWSLAFVTNYRSAVLTGEPIRYLAEMFTT